MTVSEPASDTSQNAFCDLNPRLRRALYARLERRLVNLISYAAHVNKPLYLGMAASHQDAELAILDTLLGEYNFCLTCHPSDEGTLVFLESQPLSQTFAGARVRAVPATSVPATFTFSNKANNDITEQVTPVSLPNTLPDTPRATYEKAV